MRFKIIYLMACVILPFTVALAENSTSNFPCESEIAPFFSEREHSISCEFDLAQWYRMEIANWEDDILMVESGSLVILDNQFMMINLRFSRDFDYKTQNAHLPDSIMLINQDPCVSDETNPPEWRAWMFPDQDDPYSFHYMCTWNQIMYSIRFYGMFKNSEGEIEDCFSLQIDR